MTELTVDFTNNNQVERDVRPVKVQQRSPGGCWRSLQGLADFAIVQSYLSTAKWGIDKLCALRQLSSPAPGFRLPRARSGLTAAQHSLLVNNYRCRSLRPLSHREGVWTVNTVAMAHDPDNGTDHVSARGMLGTIGHREGCCYNEFSKRLHWHPWFGLSSGGCRPACGKQPGSPFAQLAAGQGVLDGVQVVQLSRA
jgi:hypothetical protein